MIENLGVKFVAAKMMERVNGIPEFSKKIITQIETFKNADKPINIKTINEGLVGKKHEITKVPFECKTIKIQGVFPKFDSVFNVQLNKDLLKTTDVNQFKYANNKLKNAIENNSNLKCKFNEKQLNDIMNGHKPNGYTWHHSEKVGRLELVDQEIHNKTAHTGGRNIWGGRY